METLKPLLQGPLKGVGKVTRKLPVFFFIYLKNGGGDLSRVRVLSY
jgi:hypothetical protein